MKKSIYYWSPCLTKVGIKSTLIIISVAKYSKEYEVKILDVFGEWTPIKNIHDNGRNRKINF